MPNGCASSFWLLLSPQRKADASPHQKHVYPCHPRIGHAGHSDDDLFLIRVADVQVSTIAQRQPADGFGCEGGEIDFELVGLDQPTPRSPSTHASCRGRPTGCSSSSARGKGGGFHRGLRGKPWSAPYYSYSLFSFIAFSNCLKLGITACHLTVIKKNFDSITWKYLREAIFHPFGYRPRTFSFLFESP